MNWDDVKPWVVKLAPMLGTALGPMGTLAGGIIATALGAKDASPEAIKAAISSGSLTGDQIVALKLAEENFAIQMAAINIKSVQDMEDLNFKDRDSARKREETVQDWTPRILAYGITGGFFGMLFWMMRHDVPGVNKDILNIMLGAFATAWVQVVSYYFGSSANSARKDVLLQQSVPVEAK